MSVIVTSIFQSTLPRGSDRERQQAHIFLLHFNPRSLAGATTYRRSIIFASEHFNPRSLAGATAYHQKPWPEDTISIHAPSRERRTAANKSACNCAISIHAPSRERHITLGVGVLPNIISIHAPSRERPIGKVLICASIGISIHAPSRERQHQKDVLLQLCQPSFCCEQA